MKLSEIEYIEFPSEKNGWKRRVRRREGRVWFLILMLVCFMVALALFNEKVVNPFLDALIPEAHACTTLEECCKEAGEFINGKEICV